MLETIGGIIGDICGSIYEFNAPRIDEGIVLFDTGVRYTDDTVMGMAVMKWLLEDETLDSKNLSKYFKEFGRKYPNVGYGGKFKAWLNSDSLDDYQSYGNGSGMRVFPVPYFAKSVEECLELAEKTARTTHGHEEGIKGAKAIALATYLARIGFAKSKIGETIEKSFGYNLQRGLDEIGRKVHKFDTTCQVTVPEAIICFLNSSSFEDCIVKSIAIGGDTDTIACMAGTIAEAYYGIPHFLEKKTLDVLNDEFKDLLKRFNKRIIDTRY